MESIDFTGKVAVVTGGTKGIGRTIVERFLALGAQVMTCGRSEPESLPTSGDQSAAFFACDVRDPEQVQAFVDATVERFGRLDIAINNAGGSPHVNAADASPRFSESIIKLNLLAPLYLATAANAVMQKQQDGGTIINITSVSGIRPSPGTAAYGAAKAGLLSLTTSLAIEWAPKVRVNAVTCGLIETDQAELHYGDAEGIARVAATVPLRRMGTPDDVANACVFFASPLAAYANGSQVLLHGGGELPAFLNAADLHV
ncbi:MAG TPA: SDR family oxidoreductase [Microthrixaceae bacterium]|nr:SDR family oxidoreductase [Microthrixaceae bacterium]